MENPDINNIENEDEVQIPVNLERYLKDNLGVFKFVGDVVNLYATGFVKVGMNMITPSSYEFEKDENNQNNKL
ncbi:MAG: hypothetical protein JNK41_02570 [Saprospiraceae bacterium]|jgi:hypothetical protein|nr:hypothetical protein [Saprospiraceae bacterium]